MSFYAGLARLRVAISVIHFNFILERVLQGSDVQECCPQPTDRHADIGYRLKNYFCVQVLFQGQMEAAFNRVGALQYPFVVLLTNY